MDFFVDDLGANLNLRRPYVETKYPDKIYANSNIRLDKLIYYGFDMDYTLAMYKSPEMEKLIFDLIKTRLVKMGYPNDFLDFEYDDSFPVRGVCYDIHYGNFIKVDAYGHIMVGTHGTKLLELKEIESYYSNRHIEINGDGIVILSTVYCKSVICILAMLVDYYNARGVLAETKRGVYVDDGQYIIFFSDIYSVVARVKDYIHNNELKESTLADIPRYLDKDPLIGQMLSRIREFGGKTFLLTNSGYNYVDKIMSYLLDSRDMRWMDYFDYIIMDANKPFFFNANDQHFLLVDEKTMRTSLKCELNELKPGKLYSGGSATEFGRLTGAKSRTVIYVGDSIYGDILKSKKNSWKTLLIIPGLKREIHHCWENYRSYRMLDSLDQMQKNGLYTPGEHKQIANRVSSVYKCISRMIDSHYGTLGSAFRSGSLHSYFFHQVQKFADLYSHSVTTLIYYLPSYFFQCTQTMLPHEEILEIDSDVSEECSEKEDFARMAHQLITRYIGSANLTNDTFNQRTIDNFQSNLQSHDSSEAEDE